MKVKVGNTIYDGNIEPVMVILSNEDKENIANMTENAHCYCAFPDDEKWQENDYEKIKDFMKIDENVCELKIESKELFRQIDWANKLFENILEEYNDIKSVTVNTINNIKAWTDFLKTIGNGNKQNEK
jgi:hypothetical protein